MCMLALKKHSYCFRTHLVCSALLSPGVWTRSLHRAWRVRIEKSWGDTAPRIQALCRLLHSLMTDFRGYYVSYLGVPPVWETSAACGSLLELGACTSNRCWSSPPASSMGCIGYLVLLWMSVGFYLEMLKILNPWNYYGC